MHGRFCIPPAYIFAPPPPLGHTGNPVPYAIVSATPPYDFNGLAWIKVGRIWPEPEICLTPLVYNYDIRPPH